MRFKADESFTKLGKITAIGRGAAIQKKIKFTLKAQKARAHGCSARQLLTIDRSTEHTFIFLTEEQEAIDGSAITFLPKCET